jgi:hypothetical protein
MIGGVSKVVIGVEDQERAKASWVETLGFEVAQDAPYGQERWLEVRTPDKAVVVVLDVRKGPRPTAPDPSLPTSSVFFCAEDLHRAERPRGPVPPGAGRAAVWLVVAVRGSRRQPVRPGTPGSRAPALGHRRQDCTGSARPTGWPPRSPPGSATRGADEPIAPGDHQPTSDASIRKGGRQWLALCTSDLRSPARRR